MKKIIGLFIILLCVSCRGVVENYEWKAACEKCAEHGGVRYIQTETLISSTKTRCNDGTFMPID